MVKLEREALESLFRALKQRQFTIIAPTVKENAIVYGEVQSADELPAGWKDEQEAGHYRLKSRQDHAVFGYAVGPHSWKQFLFPPSLKLLSVSKKQKEFSFTEYTGSVNGKFAFIGVRPCELQAIGIQDRVFHSGEHIDPRYQATRQKLFIVAVNCTEPGNTCFCTSMNTGPNAERGYDLALTEVVADGKHFFLVKTETHAGEEVLKEIPNATATPSEIEMADQLVQKAAGMMKRSLETTNIKELLYRNTEHPRWDDVAQRCLSCGNCTQVCPTCFCSTVEDVTDLTGQNAERWRRWDSCFTIEFSYIHGGSIRSSIKSRYRQWLTHKLAAWQDQFGTSGCVGCGRCITWCPVGIDLTEEVKAIREQ